MLLTPWGPPDAEPSLSSEKMGRGPSGWPREDPSCALTPSPNESGLILGGGGGKGRISP